MHLTDFFIQKYLRRWCSNPICRFLVYGYALVRLMFFVVVFGDGGCGGKKIN